MASSKDYLDYVMNQLSPLSGITYRPMMGEYILYCEGRIFGGIYDDRLLIKPVKAAVEAMPEATYELPYEGAKEMLLTDNLDDSEALCAMVEAMYPQLPEKKQKRK